MQVRLAAVRCLTACMVVPDRAKVKGSGTEAIVRTSLKFNSIFIVFYSKVHFNIYCVLLKVAMYHNVIKSSEVIF